LENFVNSVNSDFAQSNVVVVLRLVAVVDPANLHVQTN